MFELARLLVSKRNFSLSRIGKIIWSGPLLSLSFVHTGPSLIELEIHLILKIIWAKGEKNSAYLVRWIRKNGKFDIDMSEIWDGIVNRLADERGHTFAYDRHASTNRFEHVRTRLARVLGIEVVSRRGSVWGDTTCQLETFADLYHFFVVLEPKYDRTWIRLNLTR